LDPTFYSSRCPKKPGAGQDHGFVIDFHEAQEHLGQSWIKTNSAELHLAEKIYSLFKDVNLYLNFIHKKRLVLIGALCSEPLIWKIT